MIRYLNTITYRFLQFLWQKVNRQTPVHAVEKIRISLSPKYKP